MNVLDLTTRLGKAFASSNQSNRGPDRELSSSEMTTIVIYFFLLFHLFNIYVCSIYIEQFSIINKRRSQ